MRTHYIAWWNLENLFSVKGDSDRTEKLERALNKELDGWTASVLKQKLKQLASVIVKMNRGHGPDILGVCEVENVKVLGQLVSRLPPRDLGIMRSSVRDSKSTSLQHNGQASEPLPLAGKPLESKSYRRYS